MTNTIHGSALREGFKHNHMKLELKHLVPYLPYGLKLYWNDDKSITGIGFESETDYSNVYELYPLATINFIINREPQDLGFKLLLRPLSDLTKQIEHNGEKFVPTEQILTIFGVTFLELQVLEPRELPYEVVRWMHEHHFDTEGLIEAGLAIDLNTINK